MQYHPAIRIAPPAAAIARLARDDVMREICCGSPTTKSQTTNACNKNTNTPDAQSAAVAARRRLASEARSLERPREEDPNSRPRLRRVARKVGSRRPARAGRAASFVREARPERRRGPARVGARPQGQSQFVSEGRRRASGDRAQTFLEVTSPARGSADLFDQDGQLLGQSRPPARTPGGKQGHRNQRPRTGGQPRGEQVLRKHEDRSPADQRHEQTQPQHHGTGKARSRLQDQAVKRPIDALRTVGSAC